MAILDKSHRLDFDGLQIECEGIIINGVEQTFGGGGAPSVASSYGTATAVAGAATLNTLGGRVTSESLTTAAAGTYTLTVTDSQCAAGDIVLFSMRNGTNAGGQALPRFATPGAGSFTITVLNNHASAAFNGTVIIDFVIVKTT
jgi:hypothetical protein